MPRFRIPRQTARARTARESAILYYLHTVTAFLYAYISHSLIGRLRGLYGATQESFSRGRLGGGTLRNRRKRHDRLLFRLRQGAAALIEQSLFYRASARLRRGMLYSSLNTYGIYCFFFGCFAVVSYLLAQYFGAPAPTSHLVTGIALIAVALPLFASDKPLCRAFGESVFFRFLWVDICGIPAEKFDGRQSDELHWRQGNEHYFLALVLAVFSGLLCALTALAPYIIPAVVGLLLLLQAILLYPEVGLLIIAFSTPLLTLLPLEHPTLLLLCAVGVTALSFALKLIGGKRVFRMEFLDVSVLLLGGLYLLGGLITHGGQASAQAAICYAVLLLCYFLAANLLRTRAWIRRTVGALSLSCVIVACLGVLQYFFSDLGTKYLDTALFSDLGGRVSSTMENPNILAEYIILLLPFLLTMTLVRRRPLYTFRMLCSTAVVVLCLVLTWSRGAWLGALVSLLLLLLLRGHKMLSYLTLAILPVAALLHFLPEQIFRRLGSIGSMTDTSIRYRIYLWEGVGEMLRHFGFCGVGVGESAFCAVYSRYALPGIDTAMHAHSLYLQLLSELGAAGLLIFCTIAVLFLCYGLSYVLDRGDMESRLTVLAGMCGVVAMLLMGITDHIFYNYRIFLLFWLVMGVCVAQIRIGRVEKSRYEPAYHNAHAR